MADGKSRLVVSVAMATYNGERFIREQLVSIASQSVQPDELVVCDDGSTDQTMSIVEQFARESPFAVRVFRNRNNIGSTRNFDKAIRLCRGELVVLSDQDDVWRKDKIEKVLEAFEARPSLVGVFSDAVLIDSVGADLRKTLWGSLGISSRERRCLTIGGLSAFSVLLRRNVITGAAFAFRKESFETIGAIPDSWVHDAWIAINLVREGPIGLIPECLTGYRQHDSNQIGVRRVSISDRLKKGAGLREAIHRMDVLRRFLVEKDAGEEYVAEASSKIAHLKARNSNASGLNLFAELFFGRYGKYSAGIRSFTKDLIRTAFRNR